METNEVKPSFSLKYLLLTALTTMIVGGVGLGLSKLYESRPNQELTVTNGYSINVIENSSLPDEKIEVEYYLKDNKRTKISSLFRKKIFISNTGNVGVSDLEVTAALKDEDLTLIDQPKIESTPKNIVEAISITKIDKSTSKKHYWIISLLNPGESISFDYSAFSEKYQDSISLEVIPRKKDWKVKYENLSFPKKTSLTEYILSGSGGMILLLMSQLMLAYPFYRYQWNRRPDYREHYLSFSKFYFEHKPWNLFKPLDNNANKSHNAQPSSVGTPPDGVAP